MSKAKTHKPEHPSRERQIKSEDTKDPVEQRSHVFEHRHWVNEACGDDLWET